MTEAPKPSGRTLLGLDGLNFLMADVRDGLGPIPGSLPTMASFFQKTA